jgi:hypothetical protein
MVLCSIPCAVDKCKEWHKRSLMAITPAAGAELVEPGKQIGINTR